MKITDLTENYFRYLNREITENEYFDSHPDFFSHYFRYWADKSEGIKYYDKNDISFSRDLVLNSLYKIQRLLDNMRINTYETEVILFAGQETANGHAFLNKGTGVAWIAAEHFKTEMYSDIMCLHEILHAIHYRSVPEFYFKNFKDKEMNGRLLITEGLVSYLTREIMNTDLTQTLWADSLSEVIAEKWIKNCEIRKNEIRNFFIEKFDDTNYSGELFYMLSDLKQADTDPFRSRGGYWLGYKVTEVLLKEDGIDVADLLKLNRADYEEKVKFILNERLI